MDSRLRKQLVLLMDGETSSSDFLLRPITSQGHGYFGEQRLATEALQIPLGLFVESGAEGALMLSRCVIRGGLVFRPTPMQFCTNALTAGGLLPPPKKYRLTRAINVDALQLSEPQILCATPVVFKL